MLCILNHLQTCTEALEAYLCRSIPTWIGGTCGAHIPGTKHMEIGRYVLQFLRDLWGKKNDSMFMPSTYHVMSMFTTSALFQCISDTWGHVKIPDLTRMVDSIPGWPGHIWNTYLAHIFSNYRYFFVWSGPTRRVTGHLCYTYLAHIFHFFWVLHSPVQVDPEGDRTHI